MYVRSLSEDEIGKHTTLTRGQTCVKYDKD